jgi:hypothetical protein
MDPFLAKMQIRDPRSPNPIPSRRFTVYRLLFTPAIEVQYRTEAEASRLPLSTAPLGRLRRAADDLLGFKEYGG